MTTALSQWLAEVKGNQSQKQKKYTHCKHQVFHVKHKTMDFGQSLILVINRLTPITIFLTSI